MKKAKDNSWYKTPNLIILDGGLGQLNAGLKVLSEFRLKIPIVALAKKNEELFVHPGGVQKVAKIVLPKDSPALHLIQRIRDEAHRFALQYHRKLREKKMLR